MHEWTFFSNYAHVIFLVAEDGDITVREMSKRIGITERAVQRILAVFTETGYINITKNGRQNHYQIDSSLSLKHPIEKHISIGQLTDFIKK